jgi:hypothetical protein
VEPGTQVEEFLFEKKEQLPHFHDEIRLPIFICIHFMVFIIAPSHGRV